jgi:hypothetical protein
MDNAISVDRGAGASEAINHRMITAGYSMATAVVSICVLLTIPEAAEYEIHALPVRDEQ